MREAGPYIYSEPWNFGSVQERQDGKGLLTMASGFSGQAATIPKKNA